MTRRANLIYLEKIGQLRIWAEENILGLFIFNILLVLLLLLRSAGYFSPFLPLDVNVVIFVSLVMAVFLLKLNSHVVFGITIAFWLFAGFLRIAGVDVWAERTAIYAYESLMVGVSCMMVEIVSKQRKDNDKQVPN